MTREQKELPICECATVWPGKGHHPECPVRYEIERLQAELKSLHRSCQDCTTFVEQDEKINRLLAEVERLRADQTLFATGDRATLEQNQKLKAEVERLRLSQMSAFYEGWDARSRARTFEVDTAWEYSSTKELLDEHGNR